MADSLTRRKVLKSSVAAAATLGASSVVMSQTPSTPTPKPATEKKWPDDIKKLLDAQIASAQDNSKQRLKFPLPEGSEPFFVVIPTTFKAKK